MGMQIPYWFYPNYRKKTLFGALRRDLGAIFKKLAQHKESKIEKGYVMKDHIHMLISIPPKHSVANVVGYIKGKSALIKVKQEISLARAFGLEDILY